MAGCGCMRAVCFRGFFTLVRRVPPERLPRVPTKLMELPASPQTALTRPGRRPEGFRGVPALVPFVGVGGGGHFKMMAE